MGTAFDDNWKDSFACITQNPAPQLDLVGRGHIPWTCVDGCVETWSETLFCAHLAG